MAFQTDPLAPRLTNEETRTATANLVNVFPRIVRSKFDPPIMGQQVANVSFMLFDEVRNGIAGFLKVRGAWPDIDMATARASDLVREIDSVNMVHIIPVGVWVPITERKEFSQDHLDVSTEDKVVQLNDAAAKKKRNEEQRIVDELREAEQQVKEESLKPIDKDSLDYYTTKRVSQKEMNYHIKQGEEKLRSYKKTLDELNKEIHSLNRKHPEYRDKWVDNYNDARRKAGIHDYKPEEEEQLKE